MVCAWKPHWPVAYLFQCDMDGVSRHGGLVCAGTLVERGNELGDERLCPRAEGAQCASRLTSDDVIVFRQEARQYRHVGITTSPGFFVTQYESAIAALARLLRVVAALMMSAERLT